MTDKTLPSTTSAPAVAGQPERYVGRPVPERVDAAFPMSELSPMQDAAPGRRFVAAHGCDECAWGNVLGCWRCGSR